MRVNSINPARLSTPAEVNEALDAIKEEIRRLGKLEERVKDREKALVSAAAIAKVPGILESDVSFEEYFAKLVADAEAFRAMQASGAKAAAPAKDEDEDEEDDSVSIDDVVD